MKQEDTDPSDFMHMFSWLDLISRDYVVVTGCGQRSLHGYFAVKRVKSKNSFVFCKWRITKNSWKNMIPKEMLKIIKQNRLLST